MLFKVRNCCMMHVTKDKCCSKKAICFIEKMLFEVSKLLYDTTKSDFSRINLRLYNFPIISAFMFFLLLLFFSGHPKTDGQIFISNFLQPIVTFQMLISKELLHLLGILSFLLLVCSGHPTNGGQIFISNLLQPTVSFQMLI